MKTKVLCLPAPTVSPYFPAAAYFLLAVVAMYCALFFWVPKAHADGLTQDQLANVQQLLTSYNVPAEKIKAVSAVLTDNRTPAAPAPAACAELKRALSRGASGEDVSALQKRLAEDGYLEKDNATGFFGAATEVAVKKWQADNGVIATGTPDTTGFGAVGQKTIMMLKARCAAIKNTGASGSASSTPPVKRMPKPEPSSAAPQSNSGVFQFLSDYSDSFNDNLASVVSAPINVATDSLTNIFLQLGVGQ